MTDKQVYDLTKYLFESWERGADYDNYHTDSRCVLEALAQPVRPWVGLTKEEVDSALVKYASWYNFATHLENILKEKNYG